MSENIYLSAGVYISLDIHVLYNYFYIIYISLDIHVLAPSPARITSFPVPPLTQLIFLSPPPSLEAK